MQVLGGRTSTAEQQHRSEEISSAQSALSLEYQDNAMSTAGVCVPGTSNLGQMDFQVDVHRKNSSESSDSLFSPPGDGAVESSVVVTHSAEVCKNEGGLNGSSSAGVANGRKATSLGADAKATGRKKKKKASLAQVSRDSSSSSDSRFSSTLSSCGSSSSSTSSSTSSLYCTLRQTQADASFSKTKSSSSNTGGSSKTRSTGAKGEGGAETVAELDGDIKGNKKQKKKKKNNKVPTVEQTREVHKVAKDNVATNDDSNTIEMDVGTSRETGSSREKSSSSTGAKKKRFHSSRLQRQVRWSL